MPYARYMQEKLGTATIAPAAAVTAGTYASFDLVYTAGYFGIDDSGSIKIVQRFASDMAAPQFVHPDKPNYVSVEADNGVRVRCSYEVKNNIRPWDKTILIKAAYGYLRCGDRIIVRFGDTRKGCPGIRMQTFCEDSWELKILVDAFATRDYVELPSNPYLAVVSGIPVRWAAILPAVGRPGKPFRLCIKLISVPAFC